MERVQMYENHLIKEYNKGDIDLSTPEEITGYLSKLYQDKQDTQNEHLNSLLNYVKCIFNQLLGDELYKLLCKRTGKKIHIFKLNKFKGINKGYVSILKKRGIANIEDMQKAGRNSESRAKLAEKTGIPEEYILELTMLSDIARVGGLKGTRARLYYDAGVNTLEKLAQLNPKKLRLYLIEFCAKVNYQISKPPTEKECINHVKIAKQLPKIIEF